MIAYLPVSCYNTNKAKEYSSTPDGRKRRTEAIYKAWEGFTLKRVEFSRAFLFAGEQPTRA